MGFFKDLISQLENTTKQNKSESLIGQFITQNSLPADTISLQQLSRSYKEYATTKFDPYLQLPLLLERVVNSQIQDTAVKNTFLPELLDKKYLNYRNYEMTSPDRLELTLVFPVTTDLSLEMSLYTYFKQLPIKHMYLKFITRDNPSIVIKKADTTKQTRNRAIPSEMGNSNTVQLL